MYPVVVKKIEPFIAKICETSLKPRLPESKAIEERKLSGTFDGRLTDETKNSEQQQGDTTKLFITTLDILIHMGTGIDPGYNIFINIK